MSSNHTMASFIAIEVVHYGAVELLLLCTMQLCDRDKILICYQLCQAVMFLHTSEPQMAHLDIKPANIMVSSLFKNNYVC